MGKILANKRVFCFILPSLVMMQLYFVYASRLGFLKKYGSFIAFFLLLNGVTIGVSAAGKGTWDLQARHTIALHALCLMAMVILYFMVMEFCERKNWRGRHLAGFLIGIGFAVAVVSAAWHISFNRYNGFEKLAPIICSGVRKMLAHPPDIRYAFEYGMLKEHRELYRNSELHTSYRKKHDRAVYEVLTKLPGTDCLFLSIQPQAGRNLVQRTYPDFKTVIYAGECLIMKKATEFRVDVSHRGGRRNLVEIDSPGKGDLRFEYPAWLKTPRGEGLFVSGEVSPDYRTFSFTLTCREGGEFLFGLAGKIFFLNKKNLREDWVEYSSLRINGKELLPDANDGKPRAAWHRKPIHLRYKAKAGEKLHVEIRCRMKCVGAAKPIPKMLEDMGIDPKSVMNSEK